MKNNLEFVNCNLCGSNHFKKVYSVRGKSKFSYLYPLTYVRCNDCGLIFTNPRPSFPEIKKQYESPFYHSPLYTVSNEDLKKIINTNLNKLDFLENYRHSGSLLDVGCASGFFIFLARIKGWKTQGVELAKITAEVAKNDFHLDVFNGTLGKANIKNNSLDVITAFNTIEHLTDPFSFFKKCHLLLKKDGLLIVETPTTDSLHYFLFKKRWEAASDPSQHLYLFNKNNLKKMIKKAGFEILMIKQLMSWDRSIFSKRINQNIIRYLFNILFKIFSKMLRKEDLIIFICIKKVSEDLKIKAPSLID